MDWHVLRRFFLPSSQAEADIEDLSNKSRDLKNDVQDLRAKINPLKKLLNDMEKEFKRQ